MLLKNSVPYACMVLESCRVKGLCSATVTLDKDKLRACGLQGPFFFEALFLLMWDRIIYEQPPKAWDLELFLVYVLIG